MCHVFYLLWKMFRVIRGILQKFGTIKVKRRVRFHGSRIYRRAYELLNLGDLEVIKREYIQSSGWKYRSFIIRF